MARGNTKGRRGWFGDPKGHAEAGRKGGQARGRKRRGSGDESSSR